MIPLLGLAFVEFSYDSVAESLRQPANRQNGTSSRTIKYYEDLKECLLEFNRLHLMRPPP